MWNYAEYERLKNEWIKLHPDATAQDIERACEQIAKELGV